MISSELKSMRGANSQVRLEANVEIYTFDADEIRSYDDYKKLTKDELEGHLHFKGKNLVVNTGLNFIKDLLTAATTGSITHNGVGSSSTAVVADDTDLITAIGSRLAITNRYSGGTGIGKFDTFYASTDNNGTWRETIMATASTGANAFARKVITDFTKATTNTAVAAWTLTGTGV